MFWKAGKLFSWWETRNSQNIGQNSQGKLACDETPASSSWISQKSIDIRGDNEGGNKNNERRHKEDKISHWISVTFGKSTRRNCDEKAEKSFPLGSKRNTEWKG